MVVLTIKPRGTTCQWLNVFKINARGTLGVRGGRGQGSATGLEQRVPRTSADGHLGVPSVYPLPAPGCEFHRARMALAASLRSWELDYLLEQLTVLKKHSLT